MRINLVTSHVSGNKQIGTSIFLVDSPNILHSVDSNCILFCFYRLLSNGFLYLKWFQRPLNIEMTYFISFPVHHSYSPMHFWISHYLFKKKLLVLQFTAHSLDKIALHKLYLPCPSHYTELGLLWYQTGVFASFWGWQYRDCSSASKYSCLTNSHAKNCQTVKPTRRSLISQTK